MYHSIFSLPRDVSELTITGWGLIPNSARGYLLTEKGRLLLWKFYLEKKDSLKDQAMSVRDFFQLFLTWTIILCHGGRFAVGIFRRDQVVLHETFSRYVIRKKQGMRQSKRTSRGKKSTSVGARIRSEHERRFSLDVIKWLKSHQDQIKHCDVLAWHAPGRNRNLIFHRESPLAHSNGQIVTSIPITTKDPTFNEVKRCFRVLTSCEWDDEVSW